MKNKKRLIIISIIAVVIIILTLILILENSPVTPDYNQQVLSEYISLRNEFDNWSSPRFRLMLDAISLSNYSDANDWCYYLMDGYNKMIQQDVFYGARVQGNDSYSETLRKLFNDSYNMDYQPFLACENVQALAKCYYAQNSECWEAHYEEVSNSINRHDEILKDVYNDYAKLQIMGGK